MQANGLVVQRRHSSLPVFPAPRCLAGGHSIPSGKERHFSFVCSADDDLKCCAVAVPSPFLWWYKSRVRADGGHLSVTSYTSYTGVHPFFCPLQDLEHVAYARRISVTLFVGI